VPAVGVALALAAGLALGACGGDGGGGGGELAGGSTDGATLFRGASCSDCHSTTGEAKTGPPLNGIYGREVTLTDGGTVTVDDEYLARSIREPKSQVVDGFRPVMPDIDLSDAQVDALVDYVKSLPG
jgi:cytochrome c oxidase subunit 2